MFTNYRVSTFAQELPGHRAISTPARMAGSSLFTDRRRPCTLCFSGPLQRRVMCASRWLGKWVLGVYSMHIPYTRSSIMRTNIVIDDRLMRDALKATGLKTKKEAVELGLQTLVQLRQQADIRKLRGKLKWEGNLKESRSMER